MEDALRQSLEQFLNLLVQAWRAVQLYPADNPRIREAVSAAMAAAEAMNESYRAYDDDLEQTGASEERDFVILRVTRDAFVFEDEPIGPKREGLRRLAEQLHEHGVKFFWLRPGLDGYELEQLITAVATAENANAFKQVLEEADFEHIGLEVIENFHLVDRTPAPLHVDMLSYLRSKQARRRAPLEAAEPFAGDLPEDEVEDISDLSEFFLEIAQGSAEKTQYLYNNLSDPHRLAETLTYLASIRPPEKTGAGISVDLVHQTLGHIADIVKLLPPETRESMIRNIAEAVLTTDTSVRAQVVDTAMAADVGKVALVADVCASLPDEVVAHLLSSHVRLHNGTANTISNFLEDFAGDEQRRETVKRLMLQELRESPESCRQDFVSYLEEQPWGTGASFQKKAPKQLTERENREESRKSRARELTLTEGELHVLSEAVGSVSPEDDLERAALNLMYLRRAGHIPKLDASAWDMIDQALEGAPEHGRFVFVANCLADADALAHERQDARAGALAEEFTTRLSEKPWVRRVVLAVLEADLDGAPYRALLGLLARFGERTYEVLFEALAREQSRGVRRRLILAFIDLGSGAVYFLSRMVEHGQWYVVRNVVYVLGKLQSAAGISALERVEHHADIRVRREVLRAAATIRGPEAEALLRRSLDDAEPVIRGLAAEWLGIINAAGILEEFRAMVGEGDKRVRSCHEFAAGVVRALGRIGDPSDIALLDMFKQQTLRFGLIRDEAVLEACARATEEIQRRHQAARVPGNPEIGKT